MEQEESAYITSLHLKGYKSIRDVSVTLNKGLNILIGANGSGKTNFLEFLDAVFEGDYESLFNNTNKFESEIIIKPLILKMKGDKVFQKHIKYRVEIEYGKDNFNAYLLNDEKKIVKIEESNIDIPDFSRTILMKFDNPLNTILKEKLSLKVKMFSTLKRDYIVTEMKKSSNLHTFLHNFFDTYKNDYETLSSFIKNQPFHFEELEQNLKLFSPIKNIKIDWELTRQTIFNEEDEKTALIEGIDFQFYVNNEWVNWTQLSDGTKRLFYLIGSVTYAKQNEIILIEEPELGVHPHQLALLMNFLKSQSRDKQIIISTHSPQVLNCLGEDELDRIIVARHEGKAGTKLYHLSDGEQKLASEFMINEAFLSDYWMLSGFMNEEMPEEV